MTAPDSHDTRSIRLAERIESLGLDTRGDPTVPLHGACSLSPGRPGCLSFAEKASQRAAVATTAASALVLPAELADTFGGTVIVSDQPRLTFARLAHAFDVPRGCAGIDSSAVVASSSQVDRSASVGANAVVGNHAVIGEQVVIGAGAIIGDGVVIGRASIIGPRASVLAASRIGERVRIGAGAVIGERGFGLVPGPGGLEPVPQLGSVSIADDVEIGANTTVDRGALDDTCIAQGAKIDNQVHIAHNCYIGAHTVIAGCTGIAGSTRIGAGCMIGGGVGIGDHLTIVDGVTITAASQIPKSIDTAGVYSSTFRAMPAGKWRRRLVLFRALDRIEARLSRLEKTYRIAGESDD